MGQGTVYRAYRSAIDELQPFQNPKAAKLRTVTSDGFRLIRPKSAVGIRNNAAPRSKSADITASA